MHCATCYDNSLCAKGYECNVHNCFEGSWCAKGYECTSQLVLKLVLKVPCVPKKPQTRMIQVELDEQDDSLMMLRMRVPLCCLLMI